MKILKRIVILCLTSVISLFLIWVGIFSWNSRVGFNIPDIDTGVLVPQVPSIPDEQNGYLLIQKLYSEEFHDIRVKHCSEINIDQKICQMQASSLFAGGKTSVTIDG